MAGLLLWLGYALWKPGLDVRDGGHDRGRNAIWLAHVWLGGDEWFLKHGKTNEFERYRSPARVTELAEKLKRHGILDVFPHLCPADAEGNLPPVNDAQVERFLDRCEGLRVIPWIGGPNGGTVRLNDLKWRARFARSARELIERHPRLAGVHVNLEPLPDGDPDILRLLEELRQALPSGEILSVAAYPPPTRWHPYPDVHWGETYFRQVAARSDQLAVMMYDAGQKIPKTYQKLMADWTREVLDWSEGKSILLGVPTYDDAGVGYHDPAVENITNAIFGIHRGLSAGSLPTNYHGVALYCDWEMSTEEWTFFREHFLK